ncbi:MAG: lamin tail domain-containing protein, partial [Terriglobia bacterium]
DGTKIRVGPCVSSGTFYEGVMTTGYPSEATTDAVQANVVAARYDVERVSLSRATTFTPGSAADITATFTNTAETAVTGVKLSIAVPKGWTAKVSGASGASRTFAEPVAPGASVSATFQITSPGATGAGYMTGRADWTNRAGGGKQFETTSARVRNVLPIKINEVRFSTSGNPANQFIELYNASSSAVDLSSWSLVGTQSQWAPVKLAAIPAGTKLASGAYYLLGLAGSGLAAPASPGATAINVRSTAGLVAGRKIEIEGESRTIASVGTAATPMTTVFIPVSTGPWLTIPAGSSNLPVMSAAGFETGQKIGIDLGGNYEVATVTAVGTAGTQTTLSAMAGAGVTNIKVTASSSITAGDALTVGTGARREVVKVASVGGTTVNLAGPLQFDHTAGIDVSGVGTGISFSPPTKFSHLSGDAVQALGSGIALDKALVGGHPYGAAVMSPELAAGGYQGPPAPQQWFGGSLSPTAGSIALLDSRGVIADAMVYGSQQSNSSANGTIASPQLATLEGDQGMGGCIVVTPGALSGAGMSRGRFPDGRDTDSNCTDFMTQASTALPAGAAAGATNIKVAGVAGFVAGQTIMIDPGANLESAVIATVGTGGASALGTAANAGATVIPVASAAGFVAGQSVTIDGGANRETAVIASIAGGRGGARLTVTAPLTLAHVAGVPVSGTGITLKAPLSHAHASGAQVAASLPTPGAPNKF